MTAYLITTSLPKHRKIINLLKFSAKVLDDGPQLAASVAEDELPAHQTTLPGPRDPLRGSGLPADQQVDLLNKKAATTSHRLASTACKMI
jgi:hypothetical protein